jgi:hypothetical protein
MKAIASSADEVSNPSGRGVDAGGVARVDARHTFIEQSAIALGQTWAERLRHELHQEHRPAAGGWPGTLREARTRVEQALLIEMRRRKMTAITGAERELAARTAYASARTEWRKRIEPETP